MVTKILSVNQLYGEVDNLTYFIHPVYQRRFYFLPDERLLESAQRIAQRIEKSGYRNVVVSETGARPLAYVCERLLEQSGTKAQWTYMKFPREPTGSLHSLITFYLADSERQEEVNGKSREETVKEISAAMSSSTLVSKRKPLSRILQEVGRSDQDEWQKKLTRTLEGTAIAETLGHPFLFFDEYIDSGTTLQNAHQYFNCFTGNLDFKTLSYFTNIKASSKFERIFFSAFDQDTQLECYSRGAYPFENRVDLIGYYYFINDDAYEKRSLEEVMQAFGNEIQVSPSGLLRDLIRVIKQGKHVEVVKKRANIPAVAQFLDENHVARYYISAFEQTTDGNELAHEFLWQLFEMYGPIWSPLPDEYHLDFLQAFERTKDKLRSIPEFETLKEEYRITRPTILIQAAEICLNRKNSWHRKMDNLLRGKTNGN